MSLPAAEVELVEQTAAYARRQLAADSSGHDWWHVWRVWQTARRLAAAEGADLLVVELAALLHDIADWKFTGGDETAGPAAARAWLSQRGVAEPIVAHVERIVADVSFKGAGVATPMHSLEGRVVQDADRLDALGAIGIARAFAYGGHTGRAMYDPGIAPERHASFAAYKRNDGPTINHFYEKLLLLADRMQTDSGRRAAAERHAFMEEYLAHFFREWGDQPQRDAIIFDCDGTLADTMPVHYEAWRETVTRYGLELSEDRFYALGGWPTLALTELLVREAHSSADPVQIAREKEAAFELRLGEVTPIEPVVAVARSTRGRLPIAVATGATRPILDLVLEKIGLTGWFDAEVCSEEVAHHKPAPDVFLEAARRLGVDPRRCLVYEDTDPGIEAARRAQMQCIDVRTLFKPRRITA